MAGDRLDRSAYRLVWCDAFDGECLNPDVWNYERGANIRNQELQYYTDDGSNAIVREGRLALVARRHEEGPFHKPFFVMLGMAVGGHWPGAPDEATVFPQRYEIDYVRVLQRDSAGEDII